MEMKPISLAEFRQTVTESRDNARARLEAAGDEASFTDRFLAASAQSQTEFLDQTGDEPLTVVELDEQEIAPHLLKTGENESQQPEKSCRLPVQLSPR